MNNRRFIYSWGTGRWTKVFGMTVIKKILYMWSSTAVSTLFWDSPVLWRNILPSSSGSGSHQQAELCELLLDCQEIVRLSKNMFLNVRNIKMFLDFVHIQFLLNFYAVLTWICSTNFVISEGAHGTELCCVSARKWEVMFTKIRSHWGTYKKIPTEQQLFH